MADENKIEIQIVLDDGSIQKGFANIQQQAQKAGKEVESSFSGDQFAAIGSKAVAAFAVATTAVLGFKKALEFAVEGEAINALNRQFEILTEREGIATKTLIDGLEASANGLIDTEELLKTANGAIATLGASAAKLPQLLDLSTKAASLFGGTSKQAFDSLVFAVETGNQKALKNLGIILDVDLVYKNFARTLGVAANELTLTQKQAALLDAVLLKGGETFKGITNELSPVANSFTRLKVAIGEVGDSIAKTFTANFGESIAKFNNGLADIINPKPPTAVNQLTETEAKIKSLTAELTKLQDIQKARETNGFFTNLFDGGGLASNLRNNINQINKALEEQKTKYTALRYEVQEVSDVQVANTITAVKQETKLTDIQKQGIANRQNQVAQAILQNQTAQNKSAENQLQFNYDFESRRLEQKQIADQALLLFDQEQAAKLLEVNKTFSDELFFTESQRESVRNSIVQKGIEDRKLLQAQADENAIVQIQSLGEAFRFAAQGAAQEITNLQINASKAFKQIGRDAINGLGGAVGQGFAAFGRALVTGEDALGAFTKAFLNAIGQQAIASGTRFILEGIAYLFVPGFQGVGSAMIAAGATLAAFGGALSALTSGGGATATASSGGGLAGGSVTSPGSDGFNQNPEPEKPKTNIEVNILGSIFDSVETGSRIVNLINDAFDQNGVQVTGGTA